MQAATIILSNATLGRDPEVRHTQSNTKLEFSVAVNHRERDNSGQWGDVTNWFRIEVWGKQAETLISLRDEGKLTKGASVDIVGRLKPRPYQGRDGSQKLSLDVTANDVILISPPKNYEAQATSPGGDQDVDFNSVPF